MLLIDKFGLIRISLGQGWYHWTKNNVKSSLLGCSFAGRATKLLVVRIVTTIIPQQLTMKNNREGQAEVLTDAQLEELLSECNPNHKLLFAIAYYTSARISEVLKLRREDFKAGIITFRKKNTKTKKSRQVRISAKLKAIIDEAGLPESGWLFPNKDSSKHISRQAADKALRKVCDYIGLEGVSTHSFRRTSITNMFRKGIPLKTIGEVSGHEDLDNLVKYIEIDRKEVDAAVEVL